MRLQRERDTKCATLAYTAALLLRPLQFGQMVFTEQFSPADIAEMILGEL